MLELIIVVLVVLWLLGAFGSKLSPSIPNGGSWVHILIIIAIVLLVFRIL